MTTSRTRWDNLLLTTFVYIRQPTPASETYPTSTTHLTPKPHFHKLQKSRLDNVHWKQMNSSWELQYKQHVTRIITHQSKQNNPARAILHYSPGFNEHKRNIVRSRNHLSHLFPTLDIINRIQTLNEEKQMISNKNSRIFGDNYWTTFTSDHMPPWFQGLNEVQLKNT